MRKFSFSVLDVLRPFSVGLIGLVVIVSVLCFRLGSLTTGASQAEANVIRVVQDRSLGLKQILTEDVLFLPHQLGVYALEKLGLNSLGIVRGIGVTFGLIGAVAFYLLLLKWHTRRIAVFGTFLFVTSSWFLHSARLAVPETTYLLLPLLFYLGAKLEQGKQHLAAVAFSSVFVSMMLYLPGLIWFILPGLIWQRKKLLNHLQELHQTWAIGLFVLALVLLLPLITSLIAGDTSVVKWLGLNTDGLSVLEFLKRIIFTPVHLFLKSDPNPATHLGRLPFLDIATAIFILLGSYRHFLHRHLDRSKVLAAGLVLATLLSAASNQDTLALLLPMLYILATAGFTLMLQQWFTVFPRNPLARNIGIGLIVMVLGFTALYHLRRYFVAWPNTPETKQVYSVRV